MANYLTIPQENTNTNTYGTQLSRNGRGEAPGVGALEGWGRGGGGGGRQGKEGRFHVPLKCDFTTRRVSSS